MNIRKFIFYLDIALLLASLASCLAWLGGKGFFYSEVSAVMSPFTSLSLLLMSASRLSLKNLTAFPPPLAMAAYGLCIGGNLSSLFIQLMIPDLLLDSLPQLVPTSIMTSIGLILFCSYELLIILRETPESGLIIDDIILHLALVPGGISLLGHLQGNPYYISSNLDPRVGISLLEMGFMGLYACIAALSNTRLFLWTFLKESLSNRLVFTVLFINQYIAPVILSFLIYGQQAHSGLGIEFFVMLAGVMATLSFLILQAYRTRLK